MPFLHILCVFDCLDAPEAQCTTLLVSFGAHHTPIHTPIHTLQPGEQRLLCGLYFQHSIIKHVQQFSNSKDGILQQTIYLILTLSSGQGQRGMNAHRCEGKEVVLEETRL